jgi:hypothetical protein
VSEWQRERERERERDVKRYKTIFQDVCNLATKLTSLEHTKNILRLITKMNGYAISGNNCFIISLGDSSGSEFYVSTFRNTHLFHLYRSCEQEDI